MSNAVIYSGNVPRRPIRAIVEEQSGILRDPRHETRGRIRAYFLGEDCSHIMGWRHSKPRTGEPQSKEESEKQFLQFKTSAVSVNV